MKNVPGTILLLSLILGFIYLGACTPQSSRSTPTPTPSPAPEPILEPADPPSLSWEIEDMRTGEITEVTSPAEIQEDKIVRVSFRAEDPNGIQSLSLSRDGFFECRLGDEVRQFRSIDLGTAAESNDPAELSSDMEVIVETIKWRCQQGWELASGYVELSGMATNSYGKSAADALHIILKETD